jgi:hypothetical protein
MAYSVIMDVVNRLVILDDVKDVIGIDQAESAHDEKLERMINAASWFCNNYTHRKLKSRALTEYYNGDGTNTLLTNEYPITVLTSVYDDLARAYGADTLIDSGDLVIVPDDLAYSIVYDGGAFLPGLRNLKVTYTAGYTTVPWDLQEAALELCAFYWDNFENKLFGKMSVTLADGSVHMETTKIPASVLRILDLYKRKW